MASHRNGELSNFSKPSGMAAETQSLLDFIQAVKSQGASDQFVVALLRQNGWSGKRIYQAFGAWYETQTGKPVPNGGGRIEAALP